MTTELYYPDAHVETSSFDGYCLGGSGADLTWANLIAHAGNLAWDAVETMDCPYITTGATSGTWVYLTRGILLFDITGVPAGKTITGVTLSLYGTAKSDTFSPALAPDINVYQAAPASNTAIAGGDFDSLSATPFSSPITYANWKTSDPWWNDFAFNAAGLAFVIAAYEGAKIVKLGIRNANYDVAAQSPTWSSTHTAVLTSYMSDHGAGYKPKLAITYTDAATYDETSKEQVVLVITHIGAPQYATFPITFPLSWEPPEYRNVVGSGSGRFGL